MILAAARLFESERIARLLDVEHPAYPQIVGDASELAAAFALSGPEQRILDQIDGCTSVREILALGKGGEERARALLAALVVADRVELRSEPLLRPAEGRAPEAPAARPEVRGPSEPSASSRRRAATVVPQPRTASGDPVPAPAPAPVVQGVTVPTPLDPRLVPRLVDRRAAHLVAEEAFQKAKACLQRDALSLALGHLRRAAELCPDSVEFKVYAAWVEFCLSEGEDARRSAKVAAQQLAESATKADPNLAIGFYVLGHVAMLDGDDPRASRCFQHALRLDDSLIDAERHLRLLAMRGQARPAPPRGRRP